MKVFTIKNETNEITVHASVEAAEAIPTAERFRTEAGLAKVAADWPMARLVEIWNSVPGVTPVAKFKDRATGVSRIWKAIQTLELTGPRVPEAETAAEPGVLGEPEASVDGEPTSSELAPQPPDVPPAEGGAHEKATRSEQAHTEPMSAKGPRQNSKASQVIAMLKREGGTTVEELMTATGWQKHTARALLSAGGSLTKKYGMTIISEKIGEKRVYSIKG